MSKKRFKKSRLKTLFVSVVSLALFSVIVINLFSVWTEILKTHNKKQMYQEELTALQEEEDYLNVEIEKLQDEDYVAKYAREQYLYSKDGEFNIRIN